MFWEVHPWGRWKFRGRCTDAKQECQFEAEVTATTNEDVPGILLRAPTKDEGMVRELKLNMKSLYGHCLPCTKTSLVQSLPSNTSAETRATAMSSSPCGN